MTLTSCGHGIIKLTAAVVLEELLRCAKTKELTGYDVHRILMHTLAALKRDIQVAREVEISNRQRLETIQRLETGQEALKKPTSC
jgi:hypothetical protein